MIKNCIIFTYSDKYKNLWIVETDKIAEGALNGCWQQVEGFAKKRIEVLTKLVKNEKLSLEEERGDYYIFTFSGEFQARKFIATGSLPLPFIPVSFKIWLSKNSYFSSFGCYY